MRSILKTLFSCSLLIFSLNVFAGGPATNAPVDEPLPASQHTGVYVDLGLGYAWSDWAGFGRSSFNGYNTFSGAVNSNANGGVSFGGDVGYQINNMLGIEAGWFYLPTVSGNSNINTLLPSVKVESWLAYLALKVMVPLSKHFDVFGKMGVGYRPLNWVGSAVNAAGFGDSNPSYVTGVFSGGLQYWLDEHWILGAEYLHFVSYTKSNQISHRAPAANLALFKVGYIFAV